MRKLCRIILLLSTLMAVLTVCFSVTTYASTQTVYLDQSKGSDINTGNSAGKAFSTLNKAIDALSESGGKIVLCSDYIFDANSVYTEPKHSKSIVISSEGNSRLYLKSNCQYHLSGPTTFKDINIYNEGTVHFVANFNPITFDEGVKMKSNNNTKAVKVYGGYIKYESGLPTALDSHITIKSGDLFATIVGFVSQKGPGGTTTFTGTSFIDIYGGSITKILGASADNHYSGNTEINVYGGTITSLFTGGNSTRRLDGYAKVNVFGGSVTTLNANNVLKDVTITLDGGEVGSAVLSYANITIQSDASSSQVTLNYNSLTTNESVVSGFTDSAKKFEANYKCNGYANTYITDGGTGDGRSVASPAGNINEVIKLFTSGEGTVYVVGNYTVSGNLIETAHNSPVCITSYNDKSSITFTDGATYILSGTTTFDALTVNAKGKYTIDANNNELIIQNSRIDKATVCGGSNKDKDVALTLLCGSYDKVYLLSSDASGEYTGKIKLSSSADISTIKLSDASAISRGKTDVEINAGKVQNVDFSNIAGELTLGYLGGSISDVTFNSTKPSHSVLRYNPLSLVESQAAAFKSKFDKCIGSNVIYVSQGANGNGLSAATPVGSLKKAYSLIGDEDASIILISPYRLNTNDTFPKANNSVTVTSVYDGVDYRKTNDAKFILDATNVSINGDTVFESIAFQPNVNTTRLLCNTHDVIFGEDITSPKEDNITNYIAIIGAGTTEIKDAEYTITVKSGTWNYYYGANCSSKNAYNVKINTLIDGGVFTGPVYAGNLASITGDTTVTVNGGSFYGGIYGAAKSSSSKLDKDTNLTINLNDGKFYSVIAPAFYESTTLYGQYTLNLVGGDYSHVTDIKGTEAFGGSMKASINISDNIDLYEKVSGTETFTNVDARPGADPWIFYHEGFYYYMQTGGSSIGIAKVANISDIAKAQIVTVFSPESGKPYSKNLWSPEVHYYGPEVFGEEHAGWYIYVACDNGDNTYHRMYVLKSLSGDPMGPYGNPVTKEENVPILVTNPDDPTINTTWCAGQTDIFINGKIYAMWVSHGEEENRKYQTINLCEIDNPWTLKGKATIICQPTEPWEKHGATYTYGSDGKIYPEVVEGGTPVYGDNGEIFIIYSGSGYWTVWYELGQLKYLGGDPLDINNWEKMKDPIFVKSDSLNGCGHASYTTTPDGKRWILYHAYKGTSTASGRFAIFETYDIVNGNVVIGNGSTHPAEITTSYEIMLNPMPLITKISGFKENFVKMTVNDHTTHIVNGVAGVDVANITLYNNVKYDPIIHGELKYEYRLIDELGAFTSGLPASEGTYTINVRTYGSDMYSGFEASFILTVAPEQVQDTIPDNNIASNTALVVYGICITVILICVCAVIAVIILKKAKMNSNK